jgi:uncharacterized OsmC-like protein
MMSEDNGNGIDLGLADHIVELDHKERYSFTARFVSEEGRLNMDEPAPLGPGGGPEGVSLLAGAAGYCLAASLVFCLRKVRVPFDDLDVRAVAHLKRVEKRLRRVESMEVDIHLQVEQEHEKAMERCLRHFHEFCIVTESIKGGFPITVRVHHPWGVNEVKYEARSGD